MPSYDAIRFAPPAPVAHVTLRDPNNGSARTDVPMLLDTGADVSLVPKRLVTELNVESGRQYELLDFEGRSTLSTAVHLEMNLIGYTFRGQFLLIEQEYGVVGRNVLNSLPLLLNGPRLVWEHFLATSV